MIFPTLPETYIPKFKKGDIIESIEISSLGWSNVINVTYEVLELDSAMIPSDCKYFLKIINELPDDIGAPSWYSCQFMDARYQLTLESKFKKLIDSI